MEVFDRYDNASLPQYCNKILNTFSRLERMSAMEEKMIGKYIYCLEGLPFYVILFHVLCNNKFAFQHHNILRISIKCKKVLKRVLST